MTKFSTIASKIVFAVSSFCPPNYSVFSTSIHNRAVTSSAFSPSPYGVQKNYHYFNLPSTQDASIPLTLPIDQSNTA